MGWPLRRNALAGTPDTALKNREKPAAVRKAPTDFFDREARLSQQPRRLLPPHQADRPVRGSLLPVG